MIDQTQLAHVELNDCFDLFETSATRLEARRSYNVDSEADRIRAFRLGLPRPERSVRTSPWLARIAETTAAGKSWSRIRIVSQPLSEYERYQLLGYQESAAAGDVITIATRNGHLDLSTLTEDFWLFDAEGPRSFAALMSYDSDGRYLGATVTADAAAIDACKVAMTLGASYALPLERYLAQLGSVAA